MDCAARVVTIDRSNFFFFYGILNLTCIPSLPHQEPSLKPHSQVIPLQDPAGSEGRQQVHAKVEGGVRLTFSADLITSEYTRGCIW
jgi:hypothetical protein